jgi:acetyl-CoA carboxylase carboxyl transferase subunit alpha
MAEEHILEFERPIYDLEHRIGDMKKHNKRGPKVHTDIERMEKDLTELKKKIYSELTAWEKTALARHPHRPYSLDYIGFIFKDFVELHGDRRFADDAAVVAGFATFEGVKVMLIGQQKGRDIKENMRRNFGSANPEGYRKALRLMLLAEKFGLPVITLIDTQGAYPGIGPEERGQAEAIAYNLEKMSSLKVPIISVIIGEGGSGGALGIAVADAVLMLENSIYSVISPEGCASILWKDSSKAAQAAEAMSITADKLYKLGVIDAIIKEPLGGAHRDFKFTAENVKAELLKYLTRLRAKSVGELLKDRYDKFRVMGEFIENGKVVSSKRPS